MKVSSLLIGSWNLFLVAVVATLCLLPSLCQGQEYYEDYAQEQDNLYHDYAARHDAEK